MTSFPRLRQVVLDCEDVRATAEFYRELFGLTYREGHETPEPGEDWLTLRGPDVDLAFQRVDRLERTTWPDPEVAQQLHLESSVPTADELLRQRDRVLALGGRQVLDRFDDEDEPLFVFADPAGHTFCIFVAADRPRGEAT